MTRSFSSEPVPLEIVDELIDSALHAPSAGNTSATEFLVLEGAAQVAEYWSVTLAPDRREAFPWPRLLDAPVLVVPFVNPRAYTARYSEPDKAHTGLGVGEEAWSAPYWWIDGGMSSMALLLAVESMGLGALFFGLFEHEEAVKERFGVPQTLRAIGSIAIGHPTDSQRKSLSARRGRRRAADAVHRGGWRATPTGSRMG